ncbi:MAG: Grx4 family monothiol glutaredoxin [Chlamydiota bacterium]|nr:Grx4 family monothiol glutaredoxin [Chlamydiota bacterium]
MSTAMLKEIDVDVKNHKIILYIKGTKENPQCGFSAAAIDAFRALRVSFETRNVLDNRDLWDSIQEYSNWPTFPQVFIHGQFIGGCDITLELSKNGTLKEMVNKALQS